MVFWGWGMRQDRGKMYFVKMAYYEKSNLLTKEETETVNKKFVQKF